MIWVLFGCQATSLEFTSEVNGCENYDFENPGPSELRLIEEGDDLLIQRTGVLLDSEAEFVPTFTMEDYKVYIREYWNDGTGEQFCWTPTVRITDHPGVALEFWWYIADDVISVDVLQYDPQ